MLWEVSESYGFSWGPLEKDCCTSGYVVGSLWLWKLCMRVSLCNRLPASRRAASFWTSIGANWVKGFGRWGVTFSDLEFRVQRLRVQGFGALSNHNRHCTLYRHHGRNSQPPTTP